VFDILLGVLLVVVRVHYFRVVAVISRGEEFAVREQLAQRLLKLAEVSRIAGLKSILAGRSGALSYRSSALSAPCSSSSLISIHLASTPSSLMSTSRIGGIAPPSASGPACAIAAASEHRRKQSAAARGRSREDPRSDRRISGFPLRELSRLEARPSDSDCLDVAYILQ
jgi:hypothetical protein